MSKKLKTKFIISMISIATLSIFLVGIITNITIFKKFNTYMEEEQIDRIEDVVKMVEYSYSLDKSWSNRVLSNILNSRLIDNFDIQIKNENGDIVFENFMSNSMMRMHNQMMRSMSKGMMRGSSRSQINDSTTTVKMSELIVDDKRVGTVEIGYAGPFIISQREVDFTRGINNSILFASFISLVLAMLLGLYNSKVMSEPILKITHAANNIREGKLDTNIDMKNDAEELIELSKSINHLAKSLKEQQILRKRLTTDISHELRTPLTILQSHIEAFNDGIWLPTKDKLDICREEVIRLKKLVEQLKYITDIESHRVELEIEQVDLSQLIENVVESFRYEFEIKEIELNKHIRKNVMIEADKDKVRQVMINIISNALKFTDTLGKVDVLLSEDEKSVTIEITDTGIGINKEDIPFVFERFYRSDKSRSRRTGGTGVGLTIAKTLVEAHKGSINVYSQEEKGSRFVIILPKSQKDDNILTI
ncbi:HAMP domain-containing sensor histidine kinase [Proteiniborus sp. MB09-C3]|uniref:sensor histidine kinase n=1 Tax=Proteiniborus sp. MB09-C3 TaxID=3050072 RepID=UPI0025553E97|nr:HAMP domain-containing sensor histidine kinase [Proteiniborus sp. MB09-C3]WIV11570.1 HAMP domain-containing sensor histidine kinase [Proteiniborus sp. MB09-C3]